jgi:hypothetical protein
VKGDMHKNMQTGDLRWRSLQFTTDLI